MSVFLGWMPDAATQAALASLQQRLRGASATDAARHDWRTSAQWHVTLRYVGDAVDDAQLARVRAALDGSSDLSAADAAMAGACDWLDARVRVATVDPTPALTKLLSRLDALATACDFAPRAPQVPHITLARLRDIARVAPLRLAEPGTPMCIDRVDLLCTMPGGYRTLASWMLAPGTTTA